MNGSADEELSNLLKGIPIGQKSHVADILQSRATDKQKLLLVEDYFPVQDRRKVERWLANFQDSESICTECSEDSLFDDEKPSRRIIVLSAPDLMDLVYSFSWYEEEETPIECHLRYPRRVVLQVVALLVIVFFGGVAVVVLNLRITSSNNHKQAGKNMGHEEIIWMREWFIKELLEQQRKEFFEPARTDISMLASMIHNEATKIAKKISQELGEMTFATAGCNATKLLRRFTSITVPNPIRREKQTTISNEIVEQMRNSGEKLVTSSMECGPVYRIGDNETVGEIEALHNFTIHPLHFWTTTVFPSPNVPRDRYQVFYIMNGRNENKSMSLKLYRRESVARLNQRYANPQWVVLFDGWIYDIGNLDNDQELYAKFLDETEPAQLAEKEWKRVCKNLIGRIL